MGYRMDAPSLIWVAASVLAVASAANYNDISMLHSSRRSLQVRLPFYTEQTEQTVLAAAMMVRTETMCEVANRAAMCYLHVESWVHADICCIYRTSISAFCP